jgi:hypothetical protein
MDFLDGFPWPGRKQQIERPTTLDEALPTYYVLSNTCLLHHYGHSWISSLLGTFGLVYIALWSENLLEGSPKESWNHKLGIILLCPFLFTFLMNFLYGPGLLIDAGVKAAFFIVKAASSVRFP